MTVAATSGIPSARKKLERAQFHLDALHREVEAFREHSPYEFATESPGNVRGSSDIWMKVTVKEAPPIPDSWALITGDILTNARGALDHAVFPHIRNRKPTLERKHIQYPIEDSKEQWENKNRWFDKDVRKVVVDSQPYRVSNSVPHPLRVLRELVNMDKHRDLVIANYSLDDFRMPDHDIFEVVSTTVHITEMVPGAAVARAHLRLIQDVVGEHMLEVVSDVEYGETIEIPTYSKRMDLRVVMGGIVKAVAHAIDELEAAGC